jgi:hypothetical protein
MNNLKRLVVTLSLMSVLAVTAFAGETPTGPCSPEPGQTSTPPCSSAPLTNNSVVPGETESPPAADFSVLSIFEDALINWLIF